MAEVRVRSCVIYKSGEHAEFRRRATLPTMRQGLVESHHTVDHEEG
jgi:hypothetical protein